MSDSEADPNGVSYWRGTVDSKLDTLERKFDDIASKVDKMAVRLEAMDKRMVSGEKGNITWAFIRDKFAVPLLLAFITFIMMTVLPAVLVIIYFLPRIIDFISAAPTP